MSKIFAGQKRRFGEFFQNLDCTCTTIGQSTEVIAIIAVQYIAVKMNIEAMLPQKSMLLWRRRAVSDLGMPVLVVAEYLLLRSMRYFEALHVHCASSKIVSRRDIPGKHNHVWI